MVLGTLITTRMVLRIRKWAFPIVITANDRGDSNRLGGNPPGWAATRMRSRVLTVANSGKCRLAIRRMVIRTLEATVRIPDNFRPRLTGDTQTIRRETLNFPPRTNGVQPTAHRRSLRHRLPEIACSKVFLRRSPRYCCLRRSGGIFISDGWPAISTGDSATWRGKCADIVRRRIEVRHAALSIENRSIGVGVVSIRHRLHLSLDTQG